MENSKRIYASIFNPQKAVFKTSKREKATYTEAMCSNSSNCNLYKQGKCALLGITLFKKHCPYGELKKEDGYTVLSSNFHSWIKGKEKFVNELAVRLSEAPKKMIAVGDWVYMPYSFYKDYHNQIALLKYGEFIHIDDFTPANLDWILKRKPTTLFGKDEISEYQKDEVPKILVHLKEVFPAIYEELIKMTPAFSEQKLKSNVGRKALLRTLKPGVGVFRKANGKEAWIWDGENLTTTEESLFFQIVPGETFVKIKPDQNASVIVSDDGQVIEGTTVFVD